MTRAELIAIDEAGLAAWSNHDPAGFGELLADDVLWYDTGLPEPFQGKEAALAYMGGWLTAFPDMTVRRTFRVVGDDAVGVALEFDGTNTGPMGLPDGSQLPPTGRAVKGAKGAYFARVSGGKIVEFRSHPDAAGLMAQLGLMEPPG